MAPTDDVKRRRRLIALGLAMVVSWFVAALL